LPKTLLDTTNFANDAQATPIARVGIDDQLINKMFEDVQNRAKLTKTNIGKTDTFKNGRTKRMKAKNESFAENEEDNLPKSDDPNAELQMQVYSSEKLLKCDYCPKTFNRPFNKRVHHRSHTGERPFECEICGETFLYNVVRKKHISLKH
jgi:uncharacterized Zn-finger protein